MRIETSISDAVDQVQAKNGYDPKRAVVESTPPTKLAKLPTALEDPSDVAQFRAEHHKQSDSLYSDLIVECERIEQGMDEARAEVIRRENEAFLTNQHDIEMAFQLNQQVARPFL